MSSFIQATPSSINSTPSTQSSVQPSVNSSSQVIALTNSLTDSLTNVLSNPLEITKPLTSFSDFQQHIVQQLTQDVDALLTGVNLPSPLQDACRYAVTSGGKRVRPLLVASSFAMMTQSKKRGKKQSEKQHEKQSSNQPHFVMPSTICRRAMLAVELLHAYSLIHDDLPCMDDDALRRGVPTCHIAFDEATALLAGDVLQTLAFEVLTFEVLTAAGLDDCHTDEFTLDKATQSVAFEAVVATRLMHVFAPRARRMVAGQMLDLNGEGKQLSQQQLQAIHQDKTGALIEAAVLMGAICAGANEAQLLDLQKFAAHLGLAFQVQDDILDVIADTEQLGKPAGSDEKLDKSTYVKLMGVATAQDYANTLFQQAKLQLLPWCDKDAALIVFADWLWQRKK